MAKHVRMPDGKLLQTNKKWSALKQSQKEKISGWFKEAYIDYYEQHGEYPVGRNVEEIADAVYDQIERAGIWIPYEEVYQHFASGRTKMINRIEKTKNPQIIRYLDMTDPKNSCTGIFAEGMKVIPAGTTIYVMPVSDKNAEYDQLAQKYDIHFIFEDHVPEIPFYAVPRIDIFATVSDGGYLATYGGTTDLKSNARIVYISKDQVVRNAAAHLRKLLSTKKSWKGSMQKTKMVKLYSSREKAMQELPFLKLEEGSEGMK